MPQKKNPDIFELSRGKTGSLIGLFFGFLTVLKGLPSAYDKDLQEDKKPLFQSFDTVIDLLSVLKGALHSIQLNPEKIRNAVTPDLMATDIADYLVNKGVAFREAHAITGKIILKSIDLNLPIDKLSLIDFQTINPVIDEGIYNVINAHTSIQRRNVIGGTSYAAVQDQIFLANQVMNHNFL